MMLIRICFVFLFFSIDFSYAFDLPKLCEINEDELLVIDKEFYYSKAQTSPRYSYSKQVQKVKYTVKTIKQENLDTDSFLQNSLFKVVEGQSKHPIDPSCQDFRATNVFYHLNKIHKIFGLWNKDLGLFDHLKFPVTIRVGMQSEYNFIDKYSSAKTFNEAKTVCGHLKKTDGSYQFFRNPEIWFYLPKSKAKSFRPPICFLDALKNTNLCASVKAMDMALIPEVIYHEYVHLLTDFHLQECYQTVLGESLSNFLAFTFSVFNNTTESQLPNSVVGYDLTAFSEDTNIRYDPSFEDIDSYYSNLVLDVDEQIQVQFLPSALKNLLNRRLHSRFSTYDSFKVILGMISLLKTLDAFEGNPFQIKAVPYALNKSCQVHLTDRQSIDDCKTIVGSWADYFGFPRLD